MSLTHAPSQENVFAEYLGGTTLQLGLADQPRLDGTTWVDCETSAGFGQLEQADGSVDAIVSWSGVEHTGDAVRALQEWRRVLREDGTLALVVRDGANPDNWRYAPNNFTADTLTSAIRSAGGFSVVQSTELGDSGFWLVVAKRSVAALNLRQMLGLQGSLLADAAAQGGDGQRAELCFQFATILLRAGEISLAAPCYETALRYEPDNADFLFGLGMCRTLQRQWSSAIDCLERTIDMNPQNTEARRWLGLAHLECDGESAGSMGGPQGALG